jgi:hypothetical protein
MLRMTQLKNMGGLFPTIFNLPEMWRLNSNRANGRFNLIFFWGYLIMLLALIPFTVLCLIEYLFISKEQKNNKIIID